MQHSIAPTLLIALSLAACADADDEPPEEIPPANGSVEMDAELIALFDGLSDRSQADDPLGFSDVDCTEDTWALSVDEWGGVDLDEVYAVAWDLPGERLGAPIALEWDGMAWSALVGTDTLGVGCDAAESTVFLFLPIQGEQLFAHVGSFAGEVWGAGYFGISEVFLSFDTAETDTADRAAGWAINPFNGLSWGPEDFEGRSGTWEAKFYPATVEAPAMDTVFLGFQAWSGDTPVGAASY